MSAVGSEGMQVSPLLHPRSSIPFEQIIMSGPHGIGHWEGQVGYPYLSYVIAGIHVSGISAIQASRSRGSRHLCASRYSIAKS